MGRQLPVLKSPASSALRPDGGRTFVVPADVSGRYTRRRYVLFVLLIAFYAVLPWVRINGHPAVFLDIERRAFHLFGATFNAQDFWMTFFLVSGVGFALIVVTTLWGRVWCGYACPQTVFLEGVYRRIERFVDGPRNVRLKREKGPWTIGRALRLVVKHLAFFIVSFVVAHVFLSYFISLPTLAAIMRERPAEHPEAFAWALAVTLLMYGNFAWFREQFCIVLCPYGRLQSVLTDDDTTIVGYDPVRGEPRGKAKQEGNGDCIDCGRCVVVCPTGIDIRNGLQMECIGCAACIDACDEVMVKISRPEGLIRYDSQKGLSGLSRKLWRPRLYAYLILGAVGLAVASFAMSARAPFEANLLRLPGPPYTLDGERNVVRNTLELHLVNKHGGAVTYHVAGIAGDQLEYVVAMPEARLGAMEERRVPVFVYAPNDGKRRKVNLRIDDGERRLEVQASFSAP